jgi:hypothetical protein
MQSKKRVESEQEMRKSEQKLRNKLHRKNRSLDHKKLIINKINKRETEMRG